jgi:hypothetical protein
MTTLKFDDEQVQLIVEAVRSISHGDVNGPCGLEGVAWAVAGEGLRHPLGESIREGLGEIAEAHERGLNAIAEAIRETGVRTRE